MRKMKESGLARLWKHNEEHDCGALTAFRKAEGCGEGKLYTSEDNRKRNKSLLAKLKVKGYGVTTLSGVYPEGGITSKEISFFVVDLQDTGNLESDLKTLGEEFEQDSILFIPKGAIQNETKAYLIGTNHCPNNWLGYGNTEIFSIYTSSIYTSYVNGRPFIFESIESDVLSPNNGFGWISLHRVSEKDWRELS